MPGEHYHKGEVSLKKPVARFESYVLTPSQFFDGLRPSLYLQPEKMLMFAVLADAVDRFCEFISVRDPQQKKANREAARWIWSDDRDWPFSYMNICDALGFAPDYLRRGLLRMAERRFAFGIDCESQQIPVRQACHGGH